MRKEHEEHFLNWQNSETNPRRLSSQQTHEAVQFTYSSTRVAIATLLLHVYRVDRLQHLA